MFVIIIDWCEIYQSYIGSILISSFCLMTHKPHWVLQCHCHPFRGSSSSSSCRAGSIDIPDPLSPLLAIVHRLWQVFRATSRILTELLYVCSSYSPCFCSAICGGPEEYITYELVPASPAVSRCLVCLTWIVSWWEVGSCIVGALWGFASRTCSLLLAEFLCNCRQAFSPAVNSIILRIAWRIKGFMYFLRTFVSL